MARGVILGRPTPTNPHGGEDNRMDTFPHLGSLTDRELKDLIKELTEEEIEISYQLTDILAGCVPASGSE
jgi:hypothetical protein